MFITTSTNSSVYYRITFFFKKEEPLECNFSSFEDYEKLRSWYFDKDTDSMIIENNPLILILRNNITNVKLESFKK